jgi:hypothetical protein
MLIGAFPTGVDYRVGLYNEDGDVYTDYSKSPATPVTPGEWIDIPLSADVSLNNDGHCDVDIPTPYTTTVYFKDPTITPLIFTGSGAIREDPLQFHIDDLLAVKNITVDFANAAIYPGNQAPFQAKYVSAAEGMDVPQYDGYNILMRSISSTTCHRAHQHLWRVL